MKAKIERNKQICKWYFEDDLSTYAISDMLPKYYTGEHLRAPSVWKIIKRDFAKYGFSNYDKSPAGN